MPSARGKDASQLPAPADDRSSSPIKGTVTCAALERQSVGIATLLMHSPYHMAFLPQSQFAFAPSKSIVCDWLLFSQSPGKISMGATRDGNC